MINLLIRFVRFVRFCLSCFAHAIGIHLIPRKHRHAAHLGILGFVAWDLIHVGFKIADLGFLSLSVLMEMEGSIEDDDRKPRDRNEVDHAT